jgi:hypothetical protein
MMPPAISWADKPWLARTAWNAIGQGWFFTSAVTSPLTSLPTMMVRPLKAAKPATTSAMLARSQVTVIRGSSAPRPSCTAWPSEGRTSWALAGALPWTSSAWASAEVHAWNFWSAVKATLMDSPWRLTS